MKNDRLFLTTASVDNGDDSSKDIRGLFSKYLHSWPYFVACLVLAFIAAYIHVSNTKPVYDVKAKLAIKDDKSASAEQQALEKIDLAGQPKDIESELEVIRSRPLIRQVVDDLQLWTNYKAAESYSDDDIYATTPVRLNLLATKNGPTYQSVTIQIKDANSFMLMNGDEESGPYKFNTPLKSSFGKWSLSATPYLADYIGKKISINTQSPEDVVTYYQNTVLVSLNKEAPIIEMEIEDGVPERGKAFLNQLIKAYKLSSIEDKKRATQSTLKFIDVRLSSLSGELTSVEKDVEGFKSSRGLTDISSKSKFYLDNVQSNDTRLSEVNVQLNVINGIERYVNSASNDGAVPATLGISDPGLISLVDQLSKLQLQRDRLLATTPEENPIFEPINRQINATKLAVKENIRGIKSSLVSIQRELQSNNSGFEASIKDIPGQERQYISIKRQQSIKENLYIYLLQKKEEVSLSYASTLTGIHTVEEPYYIAPKSKKQVPYVLAFLLGLGLPAAFIYGRDMIKNKVVSRAEIEKALTAPVIAEINQEKAGNGIVMFDKKGYVIAEQFRVLRTNLQMLLTNKTGRVIMCTSSVGGEGKSFVTSNMAAVLAATNRKVVVLELDMRRPKLVETLKFDANKLGLSDYFRGEATLETIIQSSPVHGNITVIGAGTVPENPSELLIGDELDVLIRSLRKEYDDILIDTPPLHLVTDASILARVCDATLYLIKQGYTDKSELKFIKQVIQEDQLPNLNIVFNGIQRTKYGYGYNYDDSYYISTKHKKKLA